GSAARYRYEGQSELRSSMVAAFTLTAGPIERGPQGASRQWISLSARKANQEQFSVWVLSNGYPPLTAQEGRKTTARYIVQEGSESPREYRDSVTGEAVLPSSGAWGHLFPRIGGGSSLERVEYLGHIYVR